MLSSWAAGRSARPAPGSWRSRAGGCWCSSPAATWARPGAPRPACWRPRSRPTTRIPSSSSASPDASCTRRSPPRCARRRASIIGLWREGIASVAANEAEAAELRSRCAWQRQHGHLADWLDAEEVQARWPWLGPDGGRALGRARRRPRAGEAGRRAARRCPAARRGHGAGHGDRARPAGRPGRRRDRPERTLLPRARS